MTPGIAASSTILICSGIAYAQPVPDMLNLSKILNQGLYLEGFLGLERGSKAAGADQGSIELARSFVLGSRADYSFSDSKQRCPSAQVLKDVKSAQFVDAISEIVRQARDRRIVILNENHLQPRDRAFALEVARALRPLGYDTLAMEGLNNQDSDSAAAEDAAALAKRGHVVRSDGIYTNEPMFAEFIRQSLLLGYKTYAYDVNSSGNPLTQVAERDEGEAQMINRRIVAPKHGGKLLVYVGFAHAVKVPFAEKDGRREEWMASRLKRITGIDPLTIDQTEQINPGCLSFTNRRGPTQSNRFGDVILRKGGSDLQTGTYKGLVDLQVIHLPVPPIYGRPAWMTQIGRQPLSIPAPMVRGHRPRLVQAFVAGASPDAVPVDQVLLRPGDTNAPPLMVPAGQVKLKVQDAK